MTSIGLLILQPENIPTTEIDRKSLDEPQRIAYDALLEMHQQGYPISFMNLTAYLNDHDRLVEVGGQQVIAGWIE